MATIIKAKNLAEGYQTILTNGKHSLIGDEPVKSKGTDLGMSPSELVLSGLALCKVATIRYIARQKNWEIGEVHAELQQEVQRTPQGLKTRITVALNIEGNISEEQRAHLMAESNKCYIHRQLMGEWDIEHASALEATPSLS